jgi:hypothetical protein
MLNVTTPDGEFDENENEKLMQGDVSATLSGQFPARKTWIKLIRASAISEPPNVLALWLQQGNLHEQRCGVYSTVAIGEWKYPRAGIAFRPGVGILVLALGGRLRQDHQHPSDRAEEMG